jgi:hypothetical protein
VLYLVTVQLKDRYFTTQLAVSADSPEQAQASAERSLGTLKFYVPDADLRVTDVRSASGDAS